MSYCKWKEICYLINGCFYIFSFYTQNVCFFLVSRVLSFIELILTFSFKLSFQKLLSKTFIMMLLKQILVRTIVTWQPILHKGRTRFKSMDVGREKCSESRIFSSWAVVAGGGMVTFVAQQEISGLTRCTECCSKDDFFQNCKAPCAISPSAPLSVTSRCKHELFGLVFETHLGLQDQTSISALSWQIGSVLACTAPHFLCKQLLSSLLPRSGTEQ